MRLVILILTMTTLCISSLSIAVPLTNSTNKHNLSSLSGNNVRATTDTRICVFCHTPHNASAQSALWNRKNPATTIFPLYNDIAGTLNIDDPAIVPLSQYDNSNPATYPNGATRLCLSCHDGVSAVGEVLNGLELFTSKIAMSYETLNAAGGSGVVTLDTSHPVSFVYNGAVKSAINAAEGVADNINYQLPTIVPLDGQERMQCTTCHDPHEDTRSAGYTLPFWRNYSGNDITDYDGTCQDCHLGSDWGGSWGGTPALIH